MKPWSPPWVTLVPVFCICAWILPVFIGQPQRTHLQWASPWGSLNLHFRPKSPSHSPQPVLCVFGGYSVPFQYPKSCDGGVPTYLESITSQPCGILRCKPYIVFFLRWPIYLTYLYLFNFYSDVYPAILALAFKAHQICFGQHPPDHSKTGKGQVILYPSVGWTPHSSFIIEGWKFWSG